jgi:hypothetical protein
MQTPLGGRILMGDGLDRGETFEVTRTGRNEVQSIEDFAS